MWIHSHKKFYVFLFVEKLTIVEVEVEKFLPLYTNAQPILVHYFIVVLIMILTYKDINSSDFFHKPLKEEFKVIAVL